MEKTNIIDLSEDQPNGAIIVGVQLNDESIQDDLDELEALLKTLGISAFGRIIQRRSKLSSNYLLGSGKVEEIKEMAESMGASLVVIDHPLSGPQVRNLETAMKCKVLDRSGIILDIFARHAKTNQAKTQVEIAQLEYLLPRLTGAWSHFQRQTGGGVYARGMGEKQIEVDRRRARERIARLQKRLNHISKEREVQRRQRRNELKVAIVGYTNSGKTTVMKGLTRATTDGKDELFATLDASIRTIDPNTRPKILLSDTVGFIRNLPHSLVESFKSTLEEVVDADLLLHVVDISHPSYRMQMETTEGVLEEIGAGEIPTILVFNKTDKVEDQFLPRILKKAYSGSISICAHQQEDILTLRQHIYQYFETQFRQASLVVPNDEHSAISLIFRSSLILDADYNTPGEIHFTVRAPEVTLSKLQRFIDSASKHDINEEVLTYDRP